MSFVDTAHQLLGVVEEQTNKVLGNALENLDVAQSLTHTAVTKSGEIFDALHTLLEGGVVGVAFGPGSITPEQASDKVADFVQSFLTASADTDAPAPVEDEREDLINRILGSVWSGLLAREHLEDLTVEQLQEVWNDIQG